jgi:hypothetical protein
LALKWANQRFWLFDEPLRAEAWTDEAKRMDVPASPVPPVPFRLRTEALTPFSTGLFIEVVF